MKKQFLFILMVGMAINSMASDFLCTFKLANFEQINETQFEFDLQLHNRGTNAFGLDAAQTKILLNADMFRGLSPNGARALTCVSTDLKGDYGGDGINPPTLAQMMTVTLNNGFLVFVTTELPFVWPKIDLIQPNSYLKLARIRVLFTTGVGPVSLWKNQPFAEVEHGVMFDPLAGQHTVTRVNVYDATSEPGVVYKDTETTSGTPNYSVVPMDPVENLPVQEKLASFCFAGTGNRSNSALWNNSTSSSIAGYRQLPATNQRAIISGDCSVTDEWSHNSLLSLAKGAHLRVKNTTTLDSLKVNETASVLIEETKALVINDLLVNDGQLVVQSSTTGTGVFIAPQSLSGTGKVEVQQYLSGGNNGIIPTGRSWYVSSPLTGSTSSVFDAAGISRLWSYNELDNDFTEITDNTTSLTAGSGYKIQAESFTVLKFSEGSLTTGVVSVPLTYTASNSKKGFNLVGNPYTAYLNWHAMNADGGVSPTFWIRGASGYDTYNRSLKMGVSSNRHHVSQFIAPMQAFWVETTATSQLTFRPEYRSQKDTVSSDNQLKAKATDQNEVEFIMLKLAGSLGVDESIIAFSDSADNGLDKFDSKKMRENDVPIELYSDLEGVSLAINTFKNKQLNTLYPLHIKSTIAGTLHVSLGVSQLKDANDQVFIYDSQSGSAFNISDESMYSFYWAPEDASDRIGILIKNSDFSTELQHNALDHIKIRSIGIGKIQLSGLVSEKVKMNIYSLTGVQLFENECSTISVINHGLVSGYYIVALKSTNGNETFSKLFIY